jgi:nitrous oxidase accessory protein NosD
VGRGLEDEVGSACVRHNLIDKYQKTGVFVDNLGTSADVRENEIMGMAQPTDPVTQNGVQTSRNAKANVSCNKISQNRFGCSCGSSAFDAIGILSQDENNTDSTTCFGSCTPIPYVNPSLLSVHENKLFQNDVGIGLGRATYRSLFDHNNPFNNVRVGLRAYGATRNSGSTFPEAQKNTISYNSMCNNPLDCSDQTTGSGTPPPSANYWKKNRGNTEDTPGICKK